MKRFMRLVTACLFMGMMGAASVSTAASAPKDLVLKGDAKCTTCHDEGDSPKVLTIGKTKHGTTADKRVGNCTSCHGESDKHIADAEKGAKKPVSPDVTFSRKSNTPVSARNDACMTCHQGGGRMHWASSTHANRDVACSSCHSIHAATDKVRDKSTQAETCFACHKEQRAQINRPSRHPIPEGKMTCSDCHNVHGSVSAKLMKRDSVNDTCYTCHMEKRGPFVHNHEPVAEDCSNCHNPHGTVAESMLKARPPFLCHQCHTPHGGQVAQLRGQGQPASLLSATTSGKSGINYTQGRGCLNCHTQIHGTNNPAAANPTPQFFFR